MAPPPPEESKRQGMMTMTGFAAPPAAMMLPLPEASSPALPAESLKETRMADAPKQPATVTATKTTNDTTPNDKKNTNATMKTPTRPTRKKIPRSPTNPMEELQDFQAQRIAYLRRRKRELERWNEMRKQQKTTPNEVESGAEAEADCDDNQPVVTATQRKPSMIKEADKENKMTTKQERRMKMNKEKTTNDANNWTRTTANNYFWHRGRPPDRGK
jgi:hypothetical protein